MISIVNRNNQYVLTESNIEKIKCSYDISTGRIYDFSIKKFNSLDLEAVLRACMNTLELNGVKEAFICDFDTQADICEVLSKLGFQRKSDKFYVNLEGYFDKPCQGSQI